MSEALLVAILNAVARFGFDAVATFLENRGATIEQAIEALRKAQEKSLADYIREDAEGRARVAASLRTSMPPDATKPDV